MIAPVLIFILSCGVATVAAHDMPAAVHHVPSILCDSPAVARNALTDSLPKQVGDISYDPAIDDPAFTICDSQRVFQYYNTRSYYKVHKREIAAYFMTHFIPGRDTAGQTGYLTIRFIINCSGQTGRFRLFQLDRGYREFRFSEAVSSQLLNLTRQLKGWQPAAYNNNIYDSYQYITFTMNKGRLVCITP